MIKFSRITGVVKEKNQVLIGYICIPILIDMEILVPGAWPLKNGTVDKTSIGVLDLLETEQMNKFV